MLFRHLRVFPEDKFGKALLTEVTGPEVRAAFAGLRR